MAGIGHNGDEDKRLKQFFERIGNRDEEKQAAADDIKDIYAEAKALGYDTKIMRKVYARMKMDKDERTTLDELIETYERAIGLQYV